MPTVDRLRLTFEEAVAPGPVHTVWLLDPVDARWDAGPATAVSDREIEVEVLPAVARTGQYIVRWRAVSTDGHAELGAYAFSYDGPTSPDARPGTLPPGNPSCWAAAAGGAAAATPPPPGGPDAVSGWVVVAAAVASVLSIAVRALVADRRRRAAGAS